MPGVGAVAGTGRHKSCARGGDRGTQQAPPCCARERGLGGLGGLGCVGCAGCAHG
ncbi:hypothetical protein STRAU_3470 [Streptomyces aurantiacus JA 4570]|uniref:Uncharacterized protein n=1 Tax=Streptomyces aurantiacus JA 4570 TaxID=1286094 RepID=S3ZYH8_9ACTN|nr:hypothetical protein STRAU_3470 [Streptomyces aurantiacus JA 4570]